MSELRVVPGTALALPVLVLALISVLALAPPAFCQPIPRLGPSCTVSALNRTTPVKPDGSWVLPNVPANQGPIRVRATCVDNGVTRSGQSDLIAVPARGIVEVPVIRFDLASPVPASLELRSPAAELTAIGATVQLAAVVTYSDGATADLTAAAAGTDYRSSNPAIAAVDENGRVTARASGRVLLSAVNEGALGVFQLQIVASGDTDGDGLPDDYELSIGLDPRNPADAFGDSDADGLATIDEFRAGLHPLRPDTDGDRLLDGEEAGFGTNPLLFDTDADQVSDGLEVLAGSDPLDPESVDLGPILAGLTVRPGAFTLIFNTAIGEASRRLDVTARLIDGTEIQARSRRYGTNYLSSDLSVASFGAEDGRIFAGRDGAATVTVTLGSLAGVAEVQVETFAPAAFSFLSLAGYPNGVDVSGDFAYVAAGGAGLHVVDVSDLAAPVRVATVDTPGNANDVRVAGGYAYVADGASGLQIVDVSTPAQPRIAGAVDTPGDATDLAVRGDRVYVADGAAGVQVIDAADRTAPVRLGGVDTRGTARGIDAVDDLVVVADGGGGVHIIGIANAAAPVLLGSTHTRGPFSLAADVAVRGRLAWVADGAGNLGGLRVIDFRQPSTPVVVGSTSDEFGLTGVALDGGYAVTADYYYPNAVPVFDIGAAPLFTAVLDLSRAPSFRDDNGNGVAVRADGAVFLAGTAWSIQDNGTWGSGGLHIGRYRLLDDELGVAPEAALTAPAAGASALERSALAVRASASDDIRVASVQFLVDGVPVFRDFKAPYEAVVQVPAGVSSTRLGAVAADLAGNEGTAEEVTVTVIPDGRPTVSLLSPVADVRIVEGGVVSVAATASDDVRVAQVELRVGGISRRVATAPPYGVDVAVPVGASQITVEAVATDSAGQTATTGPVSFAVQDDLPPVVAVVAPGEGKEVTRGAVVRVIAAASDDLGVSGVRILVDGVPGPEDTTAPYELNVTAPTSSSELRLAARATDTLGQVSTSAEVVLSVVPDPGTTAVGTVVLADGQPVSGVPVVCRGVAGSSGAGGAFAIAGVPTLAAVTCAASASAPDGTPLSGSSAGVPPVLGGTTEVGPIVLTEVLFEEDLGRNLQLDDDEAIAVDLPFAFQFYGTTYTRLFLNTNGNLSFGAASPRDWTESRAEFISGFRDRDNLNAGPSIAVFWDDLLPVVPDSAAGEEDWFRFTGVAGEAIVAEINAGRQGSHLDSLLTLYNAQGSVLASNDDFFGLDSRLAYTLAEAGTYFLRVVDLGDDGGAAYFYQLLLQANGAPLRDAGQEAEPNDDAASATPLAYGDRVAGVIDLRSVAEEKNLYVNDAVPGRFVVTWNQVEEYGLGGSITAQAVLFDDGRIQLGYDGVTADDGLLGISPSTAGEAMEVDFSAETPLSAGPGVAVFEEFDGPVGPDGTGEDPPGDRPFDLDGRVVLFTPNAAGGYDASLSGSEPEVPQAIRASVRVIARGAVSAAVSTASGPLGTVEGRVILDGNAAFAGVEVVLTSSADPGWEARVATNAKGFFRAEGVPVGGVNAAVYEGGALSAHAAGVFPEESGVLELELRPAAVKPKT